MVSDGFLLHINVTQNRKETVVLKVFESLERNSVILSEFFI